MIVTFRHDVPLDETMAFEDLFHESLAMSAEDKREVIDECTYTYWMYVDGNLAGETYACMLEDSEEEYPGCDEFDPVSTLYVYSTALLKPYQGKGLGKILKAYLLGAVDENMKIEKVVGHALAGPSIQLNLFFGATIVEPFEDWQGSGQRAFLYQIKK